MSVTHFTPPYLQGLGYAELPQFKELAGLAIVEADTGIQNIYPWSDWRGILDYLCCVEFARAAIRALPSGRELGSKDVVPARYHSASLVFFARATLDNLAVWLSENLTLGLNGGDCAFHKNCFSSRLAASAKIVADAATPHSAFINRLELYRQEWIHRLSGSAQLFSDMTPSDSDARVEVMVPINPTVFKFMDKPNAFLKAVSRTRTNNGGQWLLPASRFADEMADNLKAILMDVLTAVLKEPKFRTVA